VAARPFHQVPATTCCQISQIAAAMRQLALLSGDFHLKLLCFSVAATAKVA